MEKMSFKQYLESKQCLLTAIDSIPVSVIQYDIRKYCSLTVGESIEEKQLIDLKPKQQVLVEWKYTEKDNPTIESIRFVGIKNIDEDSDFSTYWTGAKLQKWLERHTQRST